MKKYLNNNAGEGLQSIFSLYSSLLWRGGKGVPPARSAECDVSKRAGVKPAPTTNLEKGFTLIELLVVVLIIAILAAVALPQYTRAVNRAKAAKQLPMVKALYGSLERYYLANDSWPSSFADLDVSVPGATDVVSSDPAKSVVVKGGDGNYYYLRIDGGAAYGSSKPLDTAEKRFGFYISSVDSVLRCYACGVTDKDMSAVCLSSGFTFSHADSSCNYYMFN
ncbi:prepilin-type N-terminal cleavage/methylation domain-containing protein [Parelusimicrobium proximum]|uniref:type IV pilin protein n=1 Tax=Parelusimicrobium proximum TaxID=3228953 RepID=UPI003D180872